MEGISKMINVKIEDIMGKIPFIYEVKENRYIIGMNLISVVFYTITL